MRNFIFGIGSLTTAFLVCGCATHETAKSDAAGSLATTSSFDARYSSELSGENSYSWGDKYTAANLFLQAETADYSIQNRFNLATAYAAIGKTEVAREMYASLVVDGQYTRLLEDAPQGPFTQTRSFNVGRESESRLRALNVTASETTGSIDETGTGNTNEEARILDQDAEDARGRPSPALVRAPH